MRCPSRMGLGIDFLTSESVHIIHIPLTSVGLISTPTENQINIDEGQSQTLKSFEPSNESHKNPLEFRGFQSDFIGTR